MPFHKSEEFLKVVLSHIKFPIDRDDIKSELEDHILNKIDCYINQGYDEVEAENLALKDMGNPKEIGIELNKEHNFIIGWIWKLTSYAVIILIIINILPLISTFLGIIYSIFSRNPIKNIPKDNIAYHMEVDEKVQIDDSVMKITDIIYEKNGQMNIGYYSYDRNIFGHARVGLGTFKDDLGNEYFTGPGTASSGIITKGVRGLKDFSEEASLLIIEYDYYNRYYRIEIPLEVGDHSE